MRTERQISRQIRILSIVQAVAAVLLFAVSVCMATSCAGHQAELKASLTALNAARDGFTAWDDAHQHDLVIQAQTLEAGKASLADYRAKREPVIRSFEVAYKALAVAALEPTAANLTMIAVDLVDLKTAVTDLGASWPAAPRGSPTP